MLPSIGMRAITYFLKFSHMWIVPWYIIWPNGDRFVRDTCLRYLKEITSPFNTRCIGVATRKAGIPVMRWECISEMVIVGFIIIPYFTLVTFIYSWVDSDCELFDRVYQAANELLQLIHCFHHSNFDTLLRNAMIIMNSRPDVTTLIWYNL